MTKFEEELFNKVPCKFELTTEAEYKKATLINHFKNWHSDEEFQELLEQNAELTRENNIVNQINSKLESQIIGLKSQLQQQALPVVPERVAEFIEDCKKEGDCLFGVFADATRVEHDMPDLVYFWLGDEGNNDELFARAWLDGYQVEKPHLFYLKHIDMSKRNSINDLYLKKYIHADLTENGEHRLSHAMSAKGIYPSKEYCAFTQQEIDSMQTGSYEQIEVTE